MHRRRTIAGIDADLRDVGELTPVLAALAALADGPSRLRGIAHLRGHETDRLAALAAELDGLGGDVERDRRRARIRPGAAARRRASQTYADHRMATAGAVLGLRVDGVVVEDVGDHGQDAARTSPTCGPACSDAERRLSVAA